MLQQQTQGGVPGAGLVPGEPVALLPPPALTLTLPDAETMLQVNNVELIQVTLHINLGDQHDQHDLHDLNDLHDQLP